MDLETRIAALTEDVLDLCEANDDKRIRAEIVDSIARTLYVSAWADAVEEAGGRLHGELMDQAPKTSPAAKKSAAEVAAKIEKANGKTLPELLAAAVQADGDEDANSRYIKDFGYSLAMMFMGHGVSWWDDHKRFDLKVPYGETPWGIVPKKDVKAYL